jgi:sulfhydrogenase subunit beta (sulfur reductase)
MTAPDTDGRKAAANPHGTWFLPRAGLQLLIDALRMDGRTVVGPTISQEAIVYDEIRSTDQLPQGWTEVQGPAQYRLQRRDDDAWFGYVVGPHSWKRYLFPAQCVVSIAEKQADGWTFAAPPPPNRRYAFLGVRACELAAIRVQDRVFLQDQYQEPNYKAARESLFVIAVNCTQAASTCFCTSMQTGPRCQAGFDLALTELTDGFVCEVGTPSGGQMLERAQPVSVTDEQLKQAEAARQQAVDQITRRLDTTDLPARLMANLEHPRWQEVGNRCLSCTNCTMVCPTCFCHSVTDVPDLNTERVDRERRWDSCFNPDFSYMNGGVVRNDTPSRYRQWLTHKLATWHDQFGSSGCVGCGRCITWCPVGIELTEEANVIAGGPA